MNVERPRPRARRSGCQSNLVRGRARRRDPSRANCRDARPRQTQATQTQDTTRGTQSKWDRLRFALPRAPWTALLVRKSLAVCLRETERICALRALAIRDPSNAGLRKTGAAGLTGCGIATRSSGIAGPSTQTPCLRCDLSAPPSTLEGDALQFFDCGALQSALHRDLRCSSFIATLCLRCDLSNLRVASDCALLRNLEKCDPLLTFATIDAYNNDEKRSIVRSVRSVGADRIVGGLLRSRARLLGDWGNERELGSRTRSACALRG